MRIALFILFLLSGVGVEAAGFPVLVYHDIQPGPVSDPFTVSLRDFKKQMAYLRRKGYKVISLKQLELAARNRQGLPEKTIILTFDDGLKSYQQYVLPVLQQYHFPSVLSIVTSWADGNKVPKEYKNKTLNWKEIKKLDSNPLIEVISHSHALHSSALSNPQGNQKALAIVRIYRSANRSYETEARYQQRIKRDLRRTSARFAAMLGHGPFAISWPYGHYEQYHINTAQKYGIRIHLTLDEGPANTKYFPKVHRVLVQNKRRSALFPELVTFRNYHNKQLRFTEIRLAPFAGKTANEKNKLLSRLIRRNELLGINAIVVHPFSKDGKSAFFSNQQMPVAENILDRVLHQMLVRNDIKLYLRIPLSLNVANSGRLIKQLARLHFFQGVVFFGKNKNNRAQHYSKIIRYHRPDVKIGYEGVNKSVLDIDFHYLRLRPDKKPDLIPIKRTGGRRYVVIDAAVNTDQKTIIRMIKVLRRNGIRDIGYASDQYSSNKPDVMAIAPELRKSSHWRARANND